jgi:NDMA-dependent alcohol dehydrogenase
MKTTAAVLWEVGKDWSIEEIEVGDPKAQEVLVDVKAAGLCHSDEHLVTGDLPVGLPMIGGHEGAGIVTAVGDGVTSVAPGDHVAFSFIPACGRCRWCVSGHSNLCNLGATLLGGGSIIDGTFRTQTLSGQELPRFCQVGAFSRLACVHEASVVKVDADLPLPVVALVSCGVVTGWGSAINTAEVKAGDTVVVIGCGGIGANAVQGARHAGARRVIAVDPVELKRENALRFGATHAVSSIDEARTLVRELTWGEMAESAILTPGVADGELIAPALSLVAKTGIVVVTALGNAMHDHVALHLGDLTLSQKQVRGSIFGGANPRNAIPELLSMYRDGVVNLDDLITRTYDLEDLNRGYEDLREGRNIRGVVVM